MKNSNAVKGWGELNVALNGLMKVRVFVSYKTSRNDAGETTIEVATEAGADQADVVRQVREALREAFSDARVRTKAA